MALQLEKGLQTPMRPITQSLNMAGNHQLIDQTGALDWTAAAGRLALTLNTKVMDDKSHFATPSLTSITREGLYLFYFAAQVTNGSVANEDFQMAITNGPGTTIHAVTPLLTCTAGASTFVSLKSIIHLTPVGGNIVCYRAVQMSAGTDLDINKGFVGFWQKIGNVNEA